jgi:hypothetical protein
LKEFKKKQLRILGTREYLRGANYNVRNGYKIERTGGMQFENRQKKFGFPFSFPKCGLSQTLFRPHLVNIPNSQVFRINPQ